MQLTGTAATTYPAPTRSAASEAMPTAPTSPALPPTTSTRPTEPLCASMGRVGSTPRAQSGFTVSMEGIVSSITACGIPISTTSTCPACERPGSSLSPRFRSCSVTVNSARIAGSST